MSPDSTLFDYLTCGGCAKEFPLQNITNFIQHKSINCHDTIPKADYDSSGVNDILSCVECTEDFITARGLLHHVQLSHNLKIFAHKDTFNVDEPSTDYQGAIVTRKSPPLLVKESSEKYNEVTTVEINEEDGTIKTNLSCSKLASAGGTTICCNGKECCVTIKQMKKCCTSVVPKKRMQHMREHGDDDNNSENTDKENCEDGNSIVIDFRTCKDNELEESSTVKNGGSVETESHSGADSRSPTIDKAANESYTNHALLDMLPGVTVSIPSYSSPSSLMYQSVNSQTDLPIVSHTLPQQALFSDGSSQIMTLSSGHMPVVFGQENVMTESREKTRYPVEGFQNFYEGGPADKEEPQLLIHMDQEDDDDRGLGKKRRYPTSRPYKCDMCDNAFNQRIHLKKHYFKHTGMKPFKCQECDYSTVERSHLKVHIRIHTGEKPFKCTFCEYATAQNSTLKIHLKRHHGGKVLKCQKCSKRFTEGNLLQNHMEEHLQLASPLNTVKCLNSGEGSALQPSNQNQADIHLLETCDAYQKIDAT